MSTNIEFEIHVVQLESTEQAESIVRALENIMHNHQLSVPDEVFVTDAHDPEPDGILVVCKTAYPLSISRAHTWCDKFEEEVKAVLAEMTPPGRLKFEWGYPDLERALAAEDNPPT